ncbi:MAG TPA: phosphate regulon sensor histidine kinase PhoR [Burkholderiaceae bacterium]|nr:phosphate regulon sensor histidine kinase PhoR [Burkholderiaceae bacterium]
MFLRWLMQLGSWVVGALAGWLLFDLGEGRAAGVPPDAPGAWIAALVGAMAGAGLWSVLDTVRARQVLRWLREGRDAQAAPAFGLWGEVVRRTQRLLRQREAAAEAGERRLREFLAAIQASPNGVTLLDAKGGIEWMNAVAELHLGLDARRDEAQWIGNLLRDPAFTAHYHAGRADHANWGHEVVVDGRSSTPTRPVRLALQLHPYGERQLLMLSRDITSLEQAEAMRRDFVANVSHEIRTPLTVVAGFVETLQTLDLPPEQRQEYLALMARQTGRMQTLVTDLLTLSRLEGSPPPGTADRVPLDLLLSRCRDEARALSAALAGGQESVHRLAFPGAAATAGVELAGSFTELQSLLSNLVNNAVRYTPPGGHVAVTWEPHAGGGGTLAVADDGPGIPREHLPRLTERFYRVDQSRSRETGGTGLGLAIVKHVAQRHGATLSIESLPGKGSTFSVHLPASRVSQGVGERPAQAQP